MLSKGELSYNHGNSKLAKYGTVFELTDYAEALVPRVYHSFRMKNNANPAFIEYSFTTKLMDKELSKIISSGARMDGLLNVSYEDFASINVIVPAAEEQKKIGDFLRDLDKQILTFRNKLDKLSQLKSAYLQRMFI